MSSAVEIGPCCESLHGFLDNVYLGVGEAVKLIDELVIPPQWHVSRGGPFRRLAHPPNKTPGAVTAPGANDVAREARL